MRLAGAALAWLAGLSSCDFTLSNYDEIYSRGADHLVLCSASIDDKYSVSTDEIDEALSRARLEGTTLHLYAHRPGDTVAISTLEYLLAAAVERGVEFVTYDDLTTSALPGSLALSFDDHSIASWAAMRPAFQRHRARVTFFVSAFAGSTEEELAQLAALAGDGHDIQYHSVAHRNAEDYAAEHGVDAYVADDILPGLETIRAAGYAATVFAYPYGARDAATDEALAPHFQNLRAIRATCPQ